MIIFYYFDFSLLFPFIISFAILCDFYGYNLVSTLIPCIATLIPHMFCIGTQIGRIPMLIPHPIHRIPTLILCISLIPFPLPVLAFTDTLLILNSLRVYFEKIVALVQK